MCIMNVAIGIGTLCSAGWGGWNTPVTEGPPGYGRSSGCRPAGRGCAGQRRPSRGNEESDPAEGVAEGGSGTAMGAIAGNPDRTGPTRCGRISREGACRTLSRMPKPTGPKRSARR